MVNLNDKKISVEAGMANNKVGSTAELRNIAGQFQSDTVEVVAAINGTFFEAYTNSDFKTPYGTVQSMGTFLTAITAPTAAYTNDGKFMIGTAVPVVKGTCNNFTWEAYAINKLTPKSLDTEYFNSAYGTTTGNHNRTSVVVRDGVIVDKILGEAPIYPDGYTIVTGSDWYINSVFIVGNVIEHDIRFYDSSCNDLDDDWANTKSAVGVGPTLVKDGVISVNPHEEGFTDPKILSQSGQRSFIGIKKSENLLVMGTVPNVTVKQLAEIALNLGLSDAMNLDGGASSGLYFKGSYLTNPGRNLSNALVIINDNSPESKEPVVDKSVLNKYLDKNVIVMQIGKSYMLFNGQALEIDPGRGTAPQILNGKTIVPISAIIEKAGGAIQWDANEQKITIIKDNDTIELWINRFDAVLNGEIKNLDVAPQIINGRTMMPLSFIAKALNFEIEWNNTARQIYIAY